MPVVQSIIRVLGLVQLVGVMVANATFGDCGGERWANMFSLCYYVVYLCLFFYDVYLAKKEKRKIVRFGSQNV
jgi:hypothetical protein